MTTVGSDGFFMVGVHIGHDCVVGDKVVMANNATLGGHVVMEDHVIMGGLSAAHQNIRIGRHAFVGGMAGVNHDVIPFGNVWGNHAHLEGLNLVGLKRRGFLAPGDQHPARGLPHVVRRGGHLPGASGRHRRSLLHLAGGHGDHRLHPRRLQPPADDAGAGNLGLLASSPYHRHPARNEAQRSVDAGPSSALSGKGITGSRLVGRYALSVRDDGGWGCGASALTC